MEKARLVPKDDMFFTRTMAGILEKQGHMEDALTIYKILLDSNPRDQVLRDSVERLKELAGKTVFKRGD